MNRKSKKGFFFLNKIRNYQRHSFFFFVSIGYSFDWRWTQCTTDEQQRTNRITLMIDFHWVRNVVDRRGLYKHRSMCWRVYISTSFKTIDTNSICRQKLKLPQKDRKKLWPKPAKVQLEIKVTRNKDVDERKPIRFTSTRFWNKFTLIRVFRRKRCRLCKSN